MKIIGFFNKDRGLSLKEAALFIAILAAALAAGMAVLDLHL